MQSFIGNMFSQNPTFNLISGTDSLVQEIMKDYSRHKLGTGDKLKTEVPSLPQDATVQ